VDFSIFSGTGAVQPAIGHLELGKGCRFTDLSLPLTNWSRSGVLIYHESLLLEFDFFRFPNSLPSGQVALSEISTDFRSVLFYFESENLTLWYDLEETFDLRFPFAFDSAPVHVFWTHFAAIRDIFLTARTIVVPVDFEQAQSPVGITFAGALAIETDSRVLPFNFANISELSVTSDSISAVDLIGNFSIAPGVHFTTRGSESDPEVRFLGPFTAPGLSLAFLDRVAIAGGMWIGGLAVLTLNNSSVTGEVHFQTRMNEPPPFLEIGDGCRFEPTAIYLIVEPPMDVDLMLNATSPLICGNFDCPLVQSRGRFQIIDSDDGFYMFTGSCREIRAGFCFDLTYTFTLYDDQSWSPVTWLLIGLAGSICVLVTVTATILACRCKQKAEGQIHEETPVDFYE
jgi:hypothetical protein